MIQAMFRHFQRQRETSALGDSASSTMRLRRFSQIEVRARLSERRWLLPLIVTTIVTLVFSNTLSRLYARGMGQANTWDLLFRICANPYGTIYCFTPLFLYLISDLQSESGFSEALMLRLRSRSGWWLGKVLTLSLLVCAYLVMVLGTAALTASFILPWAATWSEYTLQDPIRTALPPAALLSAPAAILILQIILLGMGWFSLGLVVLVGSLIFKDEKWGFGVGMLLNLCSIIAFHANIPAPYDALFINYHLVVGTHAFGDLGSPYPSLTASFAYWMIWMVAIPLVGWRLNKRRDLLRKG